MMPPSGFDDATIAHLLAFLRGCYLSLLSEIENSTEDPSEVIKKEIENIGKYLSDFDIEKSQ